MSGRIAAIDTMRGAALMGIALGNVMWFSGYAVATPAERAGGSIAELDALVLWMLHVVVDGKFYGLFSLLFGASFALMVQSPRCRGRVGSVVARRLTALALIGGLHASVLWFGDIVSLYAVAAVPLYWTRNWTRASLLRIAGVALAAPVAVSIVRTVAATLGDSDVVVRGYGPGEHLVAFGDGDLRQLWSANAAFLRERWLLALHSSRLLRLFGLFALGMALVKRPPRPGARLPRWWVVVAVVSNLALPSLGHVPMRAATGAGVFRDLVVTLAVPTGATLYAAILWRWGSRGGALASAFAAAGRLSLTHYLTQSLVFALVFYPVGLSAWGEIGATAAVGVALVVVTLQVAVSERWLRRWRRGPFETVVDALTHGRRPTRAV